MRRKRRAVGWGWADVEVSSTEESEKISRLLGEPTKPYPPVDLSDLIVNLRPPRFQLPDQIAAFCSADAEDRIRHSYGQSFRDTVRKAMGMQSLPPDGSLHSHLDPRGI